MDRTFGNGLEVRFLRYHTTTAASSSVDWPALAQAVALELLGEPKRRGPREWRWGNRGSFALRLDRGTWQDFESGKSGGVLDLVAHLEGIDRADAIEWLRNRGLLPAADALRAGAYTPAPRPTTPRPSSAPATPVEADADAQRRQRWARRTWASTTAIPRDGAHPARRWLAARHLWRPELPAPSGLRWLAADGHHPAHHTGAGSIVALAAQPAAWMAAWPALPDAQAVQLVAVDQDGGPAEIVSPRAGRLGKQSRGIMPGVVVVLGNPIPADAVDAARVAEGLADALALSARYAGPAVAVLGTGGMRAAPLAEYLAACPHGAVVHADADDAGGQAAGELRRMVQDAGGRCQAVMPAQGKDAAAAAAERPFEEMPDGWQDYALTLREMYPEWPRWELYRAATAALQD